MNSNSGSTVPVSYGVLIRNETTFLGASLYLSYTSIELPLCKLHSNRVWRLVSSYPWKMTSWFSAKTLKPLSKIRYFKSLISSIEFVFSEIFNFFWGAFTFIQIFSFLLQLLYICKGNFSFIYFIYYYYNVLESIND